jgi:amino acid transporter
MVRKSSDNTKQVILLGVLLFLTIGLYIFTWTLVEEWFNVALPHDAENRGKRSIVQAILIVTLGLLWLYITSKLMQAKSFDVQEFIEIT